MRAWVKYLPLWILVAWPYASYANGLLRQFSAEVGPEFDSNVARAPRGFEQASGLLRATLQSAIRWPYTAAQQLLLDASMGGKLFWHSSAQPHNELVAASRLEWAWRPRPRHQLSFGLNYYDVFQRTSQTDFRTGLLETGYVFQKNPETSLGLKLAYQYLQNKPVSDLGFHAVNATLLAARELVQSPDNDPIIWRFSASYWTSGRLFQGPAFALAGSCPAGTGLAVQCLVAKDSDRRDLSHQLLLEISYTGRAMAALSYALGFNHSTSYGESYRRQILSFKFTTELPWSLFLTTKVTAQFSHFQDPFLISNTAQRDFFSVDNENRSGWLLQFVREIGESWSLRLRYQLHATEDAPTSGTASGINSLLGYLRQTVLISVHYNYED